MNTIDLQIQSTCSDGAHTPKELVHMARDRGVAVISLTDHDTVEGVPIAREEGARFGVKVLPGIEMTCQLMEHEIHMLGFGIDHTNAKLLSALKEARDGREKKSEKIVKRLQDAGFIVTMDDVRRCSKGETIARPNIAEAVLSRPENKGKLGSIAHIHEFIEAYLVSGKPTYVEREKMPAEAAVNLIHGAGGIAVWSHPAVSIHNDFNKIEDVLKVFISYGVDGIEAFHPNYSEDETEFLNMLAEKYGLLRSAGSDYHREDDAYHNPQGRGGIAGYDAFGYDLGDIVPRIETAILKRRLQAERTT